MKISKFTNDVIKSNAHAILDDKTLQVATNTRDNLMGEDKPFLEHVELPDNLVSYMIVESLKEKASEPISELLFPASKQTGKNLLKFDDEELFK